MMSPEEIELENLSKSFEYHKLSAEVDSCNDIEKIKNVANKLLYLSAVVIPLITIILINNT